MDPALRSAGMHSLSSSYLQHLKAQIASLLSLTVKGQDFLWNAFDNMIFSCP